MQDIKSAIEAAKKAAREQAARSAPELNRVREAARLVKEGALKSLGMDVEAKTSDLQAQVERRMAEAFPGETVVVNVESGREGDAQVWTIGVIVGAVPVCRQFRHTGPPTRTDKQGDVARWMELLCDELREKRGQAG